MSGKMVDLAIYMKPDSVALQHIRNSLNHGPQDSISVNQTDFRPLRTRPIILNIETKLPFTGGETAGVQLATWVGAGLSRLRQMLPPDEPIPTLPMLSWHGHDLTFMGIQDQGEESVIYGKLPLGSSHTVLGVFQILKAIEILAEWGNGDYKDWFFTKVVPLPGKEPVASDD